MKKNKALFIVLLLIAAICFAGVFITFNLSRQQIIKTSIFNLSAQLSNLQNWKNWNATLVSKGACISKVTAYGKTHEQIATLPGKTSIKLTVINPAFIQLQEGTEAGVQIIELLPTTTENATGVLWTSTMNGFQWLVAKMLNRDEIAGELTALKKFAESTNDIYGFPIAASKVTDLIICTKRETVTPGDMQLSVTRLLLNIRLLLKTEKIPVRKVYYVSSLSLVGGQLQLAVGIPVKAELLPTPGIEYLKLPAGGNLLVGTYNGSQTNIPKIYAAMDKYVSDKRLSKVAQPLERYADDPAELKAKRLISMQLIYPIY